MNVATDHGVPTIPIYTKLERQFILMLNKVWHQIPIHPYELIISVLGNSEIVSVNSYRVQIYYELGLSPDVGVREL